jgi:hypothetical protein
LTKARSNPPGGLPAAAPPVWRRPALAPLYALGIAFVLVLLGTIVQKVSGQPPPPPPPTPPMPLIRVRVDGPPAGVPPDKSQNSHIKIMIKKAYPEDAPYKEWILPIPSTTLVQENLVGQLVCLSVPSKWKVKQHPILIEDMPDANGRQCTTTPVRDPQPEEIFFTVSKN